MSKKLKIIVAVVAGIVILALGGGAIVMAADNTTPTTVTQSDTLFAKVAAALGVTEQQLTDAFKQANTQAESQRIDQQLVQAVTKGTITQAESDAIKAWLAQKPTAPTKDTLKAWLDSKPKLANSNALRGFLGLPWKMIGEWRGVYNNNADFLTQVVANLNTATGKSITVSQLQDALTQAAAQMKADVLAKSLANAVTNGKITQAEADQIQSWWNQRPAAVDKLAPNNWFGFPGIGRGGMMPGFRGMNRGDGMFPDKPPQTTTGSTN